MLSDRTRDRAMAMLFLTKMRRLGRQEMGVGEGSERVRVRARVSDIIRPRPDSSHSP